ncbi:thioredoxin domain-containing protein [Alicyclobacillus cycloheptanicus]|uniref:Formylmethanofuran dehydrogenase subunit E n=1 Tax=Alicyclobacillus cycloheptanicus TaxID=1457 RepID=A0ABT9XI79_9BACL|nr:hypothetical protein [Alicyclobacillus cycloheptanicus]MDQ0190017.1 formylmethanofuran dehydrogenase subunit E [Alicyclobacillus cycloheptanicus]
MEEKETTLNCSICGEPLYDEAHEHWDALCPSCVDAWERDVRAEW